MTGVADKSARAATASRPSPTVLGQAGIANAELRVAIQRALLAALGDTYDCTRVWSAWGVGTMGEDDFVPVLERLDDLIDEITAEIAAIPVEPDHARTALLRIRDRFTNIGNSSPLWCDMAEDMDAYAAEGLDRSKARG